MRRVLALVLALGVHAALPAPGARPETGRAPRRPAATPETGETQPTQSTPSTPTTQTQTPAQTPVAQTPTQPIVLVASQKILGALGEMSMALGENTWEIGLQIYAFSLFNLGVDWMKVLGFIAVGLGLLVLSLALQNGARIMLRNCGIFSIMLGVAKMVTLF